MIVWVVCGYASEILELIFPAFPVQFSLHVLVQSLLGDLVVPFPLQVHSLSLFLGHKTNWEILVLYHTELLVLSSCPSGRNGVILLSTPPKFWDATVQVEGISQLSCSLPTMPRRVATAQDVIPLLICLGSLWILFVEVMNIYVLDLV